MKHISIAIFICAFLLLRPYVMQKNGLWYSDDDFDYFAQSTSIAFGEFPSYHNEFFRGKFQGKTAPLGSIGPGLMAAPFVYIFSCLDKLKGSSIAIKRTKENIEGSWSQFGFVFSSVFYLCLGCQFLYLALKRFSSEKYAVAAIILTVLCQGIPLFAFRRPIFSHISEFAIQSLLVFILVNIRFSNGRFRFSIPFIFLIGLIVSFVYLTRYNNLPLALIWLFIIYRKQFTNIKNFFYWDKLLISFLVFCSFILVLKFIPDVLNGHEGYKLTRLLNLYTPSFYVKRVIHIIAGLDWGLLYTAPFILIGIVAAIYYRYCIRKDILLLLIPMLVNLYIVVMWKTQGSWYGYRYLVVSLIPLLITPCAILMQSADHKFGKHLIWLWVCIAIFPFISMICFEGNPTTLTLFRTQGMKWGNPEYQLNVWKTILFDPKQTFIVFAKAGPYYLFHLLKTFLVWIHIIPASPMRKYPNFNYIVMIRVFLIYIMPFLFYFFSQRLQKNWNYKRDEG